MKYGKSKAMNAVNDGAKDDGDSAGVGTGLSSHKPFDSNAVGPSVNEKTQRISKNPQSTSAKKYGKSFDIC